MSTSEIARLQERIEQLERELEHRKLDAVWWEHAAFIWKAQAEDKTEDQAREDWVKETLDEIPVIKLEVEISKPNDHCSLREGAD